MNWRWVSKQALVILHDESLATHGGSTGIRDKNLLESALARPRNLVTYSDADLAPDVAALAAAYCVGLAKNHPFVDGNKRVTFLATGLFLYLNGYRITASQTDATLIILAVAASELSEIELAKWLRNHIDLQQP